MMMTSGGAVHYKGMGDAARQIVAKEGIKSLFKGAGANILRGKNPAKRVDNIWMFADIDLLPIFYFFDVYRCCRCWCAFR